MKKLLLLGLYWLVTVSALAITTPEKINYQGVARSADGTLLVNQNLGIQIQIRTVNSNGDVVYSETHTVITNQYGLFSLQIGDGSVELGVFADIDWDKDTFVELSMDFSGGTNYISMGTSQLVAVPYALHAKTADNVFSGNFGDLTNAPVNVSDFANDAGYITSANDADADATNEIQDLTLVGSTLKITNNATATEINLAPFSGTNTDEQTLSLTGTNLFITNGNAVSLASIQDGYEANTDAQTLSVIGTDLSIAGGNTVDISSAQDGFEANTDSQTLSLTGTNLSIAGGNTVDVSSLQDGFEANTDAQTIDAFSLTGTTLSLSLANDGQANQTVDLASLSGGAAVFENTSGAINNAIGTYTNIDFVFGAPQLNSDGVANHNYRFFYDKGKGAFRAGYAASTEWDNANLGQFSFATGRTNTASGLSSTAMGERSVASGSYSLAAGRLATASGLESIALGRTTTASGEKSVALGFAANAVGVRSIALGSSSTAQAFKSTVVGTYNVVSGNSTTWVATDPVFVVGNGNASPSNALTVLKNGNMGIGVIDPDAKLEVNGQVKITGGIPGVGKVLTSDANGLASWVAPSGSGTDDQTVDQFSLSGTILSLSLESDGQVAKTVNLSALQDGFEANTDSQNLSISGNTLSITNGNSIVIPSGGAGTDDQVVDVFSLSGTTLSLSLESDGQVTKTVDLASIQDGTGTDAQTISLTGNNLSITGGNTINLSGINTQLSEAEVDAFVGNNGYITSEVDGSTTNELQTLALSGTNLSISGKNTIDLSSVQDGTGTDTQTLSISGSTLSISNGNSVALPGGGGTDDQIVDVFSLSGTTLSLSLENDAQANKTVNLSSLQDGTGTDDQVVDVFSLSGTTLSLSLESDGQANKTVDLSALPTGAFKTATGITSNSTGNYTTDDFVFGSSSLNSNGTANEANRFFFDKSKAGFRAGYANLTAFDAGNIGLYSAAFGNNPIASGANSFAVGYYSTATATGAIAIGYSANSSDTYATALGFETDATWAYATAFGKGTLASKYATTAFGFETVASSSYATASGYQSVASGQFSTASGRGTSAQSHSSVAVGSYNTLLGGDAANWVTSDPIFIIGNGASNVARSTAVTVLKNGNVGIGSTSPTAKLQVNGTVNINYVLHLGPLAAAPAGGVMGDLYVGTNGKLYFHNGTTWKEVSLVP